MSTVNYTTTNQPLPWMVPYMRDYLSRAQDVANAEYVQSPTQVANPNAVLQSGWQAVQNRATQGSPVMDAANTTLQNTLQGGFINQNPYLDQSIQNAQGDLTKAWNAVQKPQWDTAMQQSGSFGNTGVKEANTYAAEGLQQNLGRIATDMRMGAYNTERGYQNAALGLAPTFANQDYVDANALLNVGNQRQGYADRNAAQNYNWWQESQRYPLDRLNVLGNAVGMNPGGSTTQTQPGVSTAANVVGGALTGAQLAKIIADLMKEP